MAAKVTLGVTELITGKNWRAVQRNLRTDHAEPGRVCRYELVYKMCLAPLMSHKRNPTLQGDDL